MKKLRIFWGIFLEDSRKTVAWWDALCFRNLVRMNVTWQKLEKTSSTCRSLSLEWGLAPEKLIETSKPLLWGRSPDARNVVFRLLSWLFEPSTQVTSTLLRSLVGSLEVLELALDRLILVLEHITRLGMVTASVTVLSLLDRELKSQVILPTSEQWTSFP